MIAQRIKLGEGQDPAEFARFMRDEFMPAMRRGPTRIGQATYLELFQGNTQNTLDEFLLLIEGLMNFRPGFAGQELAERFAGFSPQLDALASDFRSVAVWRAADDVSSSI